MAIAQRPLATRRDLIRVFSEDRVVAVIRTSTPELAERCAHVLADAGVRLIEITLTVPNAFEVIERLSSDDAIADHGATIGAGTVLNGRQAEDSLLAGARFLVSPILVPSMIEVGRSRDAMTMPGTMTPTEIVQAAELGADYIKIFPIQSLGGPAYSRGECRVSYWGRVAARKRWTLAPTALMSPFSTRSGRTSGFPIP